MSKALLLIGAGVGAAAAIYLLDEKEGKKRRNKLRKQFESTLDVAGDKWGEYSHEFKKRAPEYSKFIGDRAQKYWRSTTDKAGEFSRDLGKNAGTYAKTAGDRTVEYVKHGQVRWSPSARFTGAIGSALAFYGAGRPGLYGILLRTLSLGMFLRALMASR